MPIILYDYADRMMLKIINNIYLYIFDSIIQVLLCLLVVDFDSKKVS